MTFATTYSNKNREIFDLRSLLEPVKFIIVNFILALIFLFITLEELEWSAWSSSEQITYEIIDETSWNIKILIKKVKHGTLRKVN